MATIYYPQGSQLLQRNTVSGSQVVQVINSPSNAIFYFDQSGSMSSGSIVIDTASYALTSSNQLTSNIALYVNSGSGNDNNNGFTTSSAFQTIQKAVNTVSQYYISAGVSASIMVADGTYSQSVTLQPFCGPGSAIIVGNTSTPQNVIVQGGTSHAFFAPADARWQISGLEFRSSNSSGVTADGGGIVIIQSGIRCGTCSVHQLNAQHGGIIRLGANYSIVGGASNHMIAFNNGIIITSVSPLTASLSGTPAYSGQFVYARGCGSITTWNTLFSGAATGIRYNAIVNGTIDTNGGGANFFPGSVAGSTATGGQYV